MTVAADSPALVPDPKYTRLAGDDQIERATKCLQQCGFEVLVVSSVDEARREVLARVPAGSEVFDATSRTLEETGIVQALSQAPGITMLRPKFLALDRKTQGKQMRQISQSPDVIVGSVHAVTEDGQILVGSATGSQLGPYSSGAGRVIWIVGTQKIVPTLEEGLARLERYALPREDERALKAYGIHSFLSKILIIRREFVPGRCTLILVKQQLGF
jgi:L-lactate utilization protein LutC